MEEDVPPFNLGQNAESNRLSTNTNEAFIPTPTSPLTDKEDDSVYEDAVSHTLSKDLNSESNFYTLGTSSSVQLSDEFSNALDNNSRVKDDESDDSPTLGRNDQLNSSLESLDLEVPSSYQVEPVDFPSSPGEMKQAPGFILPIEAAAYNNHSDDDEDQSTYQAQLLSNCQDVRLIRERPLHKKKDERRRIISVSQDILFGNHTDDDQKTETGSSLGDEDIDMLLDSPDEMEDSILERLGNEQVPPIQELSAEEERFESRAWKSCTVGGMERKIDLKVLEPYKRVVSHGGYLSQGSHNAIIVFSACYLPDRSRVDYDYVMNNLFMYVLTTLDQLITDDYVLIYLHGATSRSCMPKFSWLKQCYQMIDRRLRKNLKGLYLVHPTFWLKTLVLMTKPFVSAKFSKKLFFIYSLSELFRKIPLEQASIPDRVKKYDYSKFKIESVLEPY